MQEQTATTGEIARNVDEAASGTEEVSTNIAAVEQTARTSGDAAADIRTASLDLSRQAEYLNQEVSHFLHQVRAEKGERHLVEWDDALATGSPAIDGHHRQILELLNDFYAKMMDGEGAAGAAAMMAELDRTVRRHFVEEEAIMAGCAYPGLAAHRRNHGAFLTRFDTLKAALLAGADGAVVEFFEVSAGWLKDHIQVEDGALAVFMRTRRAAA